MIGVDWRSPKSNPHFCHQLTREPAIAYDDSSRSMRADPSAVDGVFDFGFSNGYLTLNVPKKKGQEPRKVRTFVRSFLIAQSRLIRIDNQVEMTFKALPRHALRNLAAPLFPPRRIQRNNPSAHRQT